MVGIRAMFAELSGDEPDWFQLCFVFERRREVQLEKQREAQRLIDWRKRGGPPRKRGRPRLMCSADEIKERRRKQNLAAWHRWNEKQKARAA